MKSVFPWKKFILALATFSGSIIGVGLFSLPYIAYRVGFGMMLFYFLILGSLVIFIHLLYGEISLKTPDYKRLPGFAKIYLGKWGEKTALISSTLGLLGAILAYLIVGGDFLGELLSPILGGDKFLYTLLYLIAGGLLIFLGVKIISKIEFWGLILFFVVLILIFLKAKNFINLENLSFTGNEKWGIKDFFLPYGPILFSLWGADLIPEIEEMLKEHKKWMKKLIILGILIPLVVYLFFVCLILGVTGSGTSESAIPALQDFLGSRVVALALFFGVITTFTSFITMGLTLRKVLSYDLKISRTSAWFITCLVPLLLFLLGVKKFIPVISFVGGVMLGINGILILLMYQKIKSAKFKFVSLPLILIFILGIIYEITYFLK